MDKNHKKRSNSDNSRKTQRTFAFQVLYALNFVPDPDSLKKTYAIFQNESSSVRWGEDSFSWSLVYGVWKNFDDLNSIIASYSQNWKIQRIAKIEITILRLAVYEMRYCPDIPLKVAINEGIELAKIFGDDSSRNFVNGILDAVAKDIKNGKFGISKGF